MTMTLAEIQRANNCDAWAALQIQSGNGKVCIGCGRQFVPNYRKAGLVICAKCSDDCKKKDDT